MSVEFATNLLQVWRIRLQLTKNLRTALKTIFKIDYSRISSAEPECIRTEVKTKHHDQVWIAPCTTEGGYKK